MRWSILLLIMVSAACGTKDKALCERFYQPYPDFISGRERTKANAELLDAMALYSDKDFAGASKGLAGVIERDSRDNTSRLYLASALLGAGDAYKAEMHLDFLEDGKAPELADQVEWFNALCWLCEGQVDKARQQAAWIAGKPRHTYKKEAQEMAAALSAK